MSSIYRGKLLEKTPLRIVFCDGNPDYVRTYAARVTQICQSQNGALPHEITCYSTGRQLIADLKCHPDHPTIVIVEADLSDSQSLQIEREIRNMGHTCQLIILAQSDAYVLEAFEVDAAAYLIKSQTTLESFTTTFIRVLRKALEQISQYVTFICAGYHETVLLHDIQYFEVKRKIITVYHNGRAFDFYSTLGRIEGALASAGFLRVHRKYLIALSRVSRHNFEELTLDCGTTIPIGTNYRKRVSDILHARSALTV